MLQLKINACLNNCNTLTIQEETGLYDVNDNPNGYGAPNQEISDIESAIITVESLTDGVIYDETFDVTTIAQGSSTGEELLETIYNQFEDGRICITYTQTFTDGSIYVITHKLYVNCNVECCVNNYAVNLDKYLCDVCNSDKIIGKAITMETLFYSLLSAKAASNDCAFENILIRLQRMCSDSSSNFTIKSCQC